ncbi:MAG: hypothetical protein ABEN55_18400 [Bradymonadaceae bacterium]
MPGDRIQAPGLEYYIASETDEGRRMHFASPDDPHPVVIHGETAQTRRQKRLARHGGYRSTFELRGEMTQYGGRLADPNELPEGKSGDDVTTEPFTDKYWKVELEYTYRVLSMLYDIRFGLGVEISDPLEAGLRAGVATRRQGTSSGFVGGLHLSYSL